MTIMGPNTVTFSSSSNSYTGATNILGGNLVLSGSGTINSSSRVNIDGGGSLVLASSAGVQPPVNLQSGSISGKGSFNSITVADSASNVIANTATGEALTIGSLTFEGAASLDLAFNTIFGAPVVTNSLTANGGAGSVVVGLDVQGELAFNTNYDLIKFNSLSGNASAFTIGQVTGLSARTESSIVTTGSSIALAIGNGTSIYWTGLDSEDWQVGLSGTQKNWKQTSDNAPTDFLVHDQVVFNDAGDVDLDGAVTVNISGDPVVPGHVSFENSTAVSYTLNGNGIASGSISKSGTGTVTINAANTHAGGTVFSGGRLNVGHASALGTGPLAFFNLRFAAWPLHPVGYLLAMSWGTRQIWFSIFLGWLAKSLIVNYGGPRLLAASRPVLLGLIFGEAAAVAFWLTVSLLLHAMGEPYHAIWVLPG